MPAFFTHYAFCVKNYRSLKDSSLKKMIKEHKNAYALGAIGPDIFFYYMPDCRLKDKSPGSLMHEKHTQLFFENILKRAEIMPKKKQKIAYAYIAGFIGHYELDVNCHPFVYEETDSEIPSLKMAQHYELEGAMDVYSSYEYLHRLPTELKQRELIRISKEERKVISTLLADAYCATYRTSKQTRLRMVMILKAMRAVIFLLEDKRGIKERVWTRAEKLFAGHAVLGPLFINNNTYSYTVEDWYAFHKYFRKGVKAYQSIMPYYEKYVVKKGDKRKSRKELLEKIGNDSYHAGKVIAL